MYKYNETSEAYNQACEVFWDQVKAYHAIHLAYRARTIGDDEFLAGRKAYDEAQATIDDAERVELES